MTSDDKDLVVRGAEHALSDIRVERQERADGRYVLYFSWAVSGDVPPEEAEPRDDV